MSTLSDYIDTVRVTIRDSNPSSYTFEDEELIVFINSAVRTYSKYRPRKKPYTFSLISGQSNYTLPTDWIRVDQESFNRAVQPANEIDSSQFASFVLPNINNSVQLQSTNFDWYDSDQFVIVTPTPMYSADLNFSYYIVHSVDDDKSTIPDVDMVYVCYLASSEALKAMAIEHGSDLQKYKIGSGLNIDDSKIPDHLLTSAEKYWCIFENNIIRRPFGVGG